MGKNHPPSLVVFILYRGFHENIAADTWIEWQMLWNTEKKSWNPNIKKNTSLAHVVHKKTTFWNTNNRREQSWWHPANISQQCSLKFCFVSLGWLCVSLVVSFGYPPMQEGTIRDCSKKRENFQANVRGAHRKLIFHALVSMLALKTSLKEFFSSNQTGKCHMPHPALKADLHFALTTCANLIYLLIQQQN